MWRSRVFVCIVYCRGKACIGPHFLFLEGSSSVNAKSFALRFFLYRPFTAPDTMCLIWTRLKRLQGIVRILKSVSHWNQINIYKHRWSMRWTGLVSCLGPMRPHVFAIGLFVWVCSVSPLVPNPPFRSWSHPWSFHLDGGWGGESRRISCCLFCVATRVGFSATMTLTLLWVIWTEVHTPRQVKMTVWPCSHGFAMDLKTGSTVRWQIPRMAINQHGG